MLNSGERIGHIEKVLPACRRLLGDGVSQARGALNYLLLLAFAVTPFAIVVPIAITTFVLPKYREVFAGMSGDSKLPPFTEWVFAHSGWILSVQIGILVFIWLSAVFYIGGPRLHGWIGRFLPGGPGLADVSTALAATANAAGFHGDARTAARRGNSRTRGGASGGWIRSQSPVAPPRPVCGFAVGSRRSIAGSHSDNGCLGRIVLAPDECAAAAQRFPPGRWRAGTIRWTRRRFKWNKPWRNLPPPRWCC